MQVKSLCLTRTGYWNYFAVNCINVIIWDFRVWWRILDRDWDQNWLICILGQDKKFGSRIHLWFCFFYPPFLSLHSPHINERNKYLQGLYLKSFFFSFRPNFLVALLFKCIVIAIFFRSLCLVILFSLMDDLGSTLYQNLNFDIREN